MSPNEAGLLFSGRCGLLIVKSHSKMLTATSGYDIRVTLLLLTNSAGYVFSENLCFHNQTVARDKTIFSAVTVRTVIHTPSYPNLRRVAKKRFKR